ncbi:cysteine dioxygenase like protein [Zymoseptoria brevis]|uniref:Cysteine dioxygenase n=1 Tax=Zymoseptoria brevis TaxID=1047168 RepID=A0A0F4GIY7_9PEZI|nr:cysteine dioxygenase like protein [Zymoseptoria brevis]
MSSYQSQEHDWDRYAFPDASRGYTRNLVSNINGKANLLLLVWTPGKGSPIHDHANAHCVMKILKGRLTETVYAWPCEDPTNPTACATAADSAYPSTAHTCSSRRSSQGIGRSELEVTKETVYAADQVTYMSDSIGLHRIRNPSNEEFAVSLHLYTPPNAAKHGCHIFDPRTGQKSHVAQCHFYSEYGVKTA